MMKNERSDTKKQITKKKSSNTWDQNITYKRQMRILVNQFLFIQKSLVKHTQPHSNKEKHLNIQNNWKW